MYRIRFHGRGGQGIKTASRVLGTALFREGFEVQDAPRYGAERRGAPIFAYVRAGRAAIDERGPIERPDLVVVADETLVQVPAAAVLKGLAPPGVLLIATNEQSHVWQTRLGFSGQVLTLDPRQEESEVESEQPQPPTPLGATCVGAAARMIGVISFETLEAALREELAGLAPAMIERNVEQTRRGFDQLAPHRSCVVESDERPRALAKPEWVELSREPVSLSAPDILAAATSERVPTGLWRTMRPEIDYQYCNHCSWICSTLCPDAAIDVGEQREPIIDYDHCKGCLLCAAVCPPHAIRIEPEPSPVQLQSPPDGSRTATSHSADIPGHGGDGRQE
jgi:pyruvate ferredoxin oxidoreductase gamma subunit